jgi:hypothetical protein
LRTQHQSSSARVLCFHLPHYHPNKKSHEDSFPSGKENLRGFFGIDSFRNYSRRASFFMEAQASLYIKRLLPIWLFNENRLTRSSFHCQSFFIIDPAVSIGRHCKQKSYAQRAFTLEIGKDVKSIFFYL